MYTAKDQFKDLFVHHYTQARVYMHRAISRQVVPKGPILDIGGGRQSYLRVLPHMDKKDIVLLDVAEGADIVCNVEEGIPAEDNSFNTVFMFNLLVLIYDYKFLMSEVKRVLRPGGTMYIWSPFIHNISNHPVDYFRLSDNALYRILEEAGFSEVSIQPHGGLIAAIGTFLGQLLSFLPILQDTVHATCLPLNDLLSRMKKNNTVYWPLAYMVTAKK